MYSLLLLLPLLLTSIIFFLYLDLQGSGKVLLGVVDAIVATRPSNTP
jgi:hypothetical protein